MNNIKIPQTIKPQLPKLDPELEKWLSKRELKRLKKYG